MTKSLYHQMLDVLINKIIHIKTNSQLYKRFRALCDSGKRYQSVYESTYRFWDFIMSDLTSYNISELSKLYDEQNSAFGLLKLINIISQNRSWYFENSEQYELTDRNFNDFINDLQQEYSSVKNITKELKIIRDTKIAHNDKKYMINGNAVYDNFTWDDFEMLINTASRICNRISCELYSKKYLMEVDANCDLILLLKYAKDGMDKMNG